MCFGRAQFLPALPCPVFDGTELDTVYLPQFANNKDMDRGGLAPRGRSASNGSTFRRRACLQRVQAFSSLVACTRFRLRGRRQPPDLTCLEAKSNRHGWSPRI